MAARCHPRSRRWRAGARAAQASRRALTLMLLPPFSQHFTFAFGDRRMIRRTAASALFAIALSASSLAAQGLAQAPRDSLSAVVVTATRVPIATAAPLSTSTILKGDDLSAQGITRVEDALRLVVGAQVVSSGPVGSQTSLFLRGGNSNYVRVLVDGVPLNEE